jgi:hypothetical protein
MLFRELRLDHTGLEPISSVCKNLQRTSDNTIEESISCFVKGKRQNMENNQAVFISGELQYSQQQSIEIADDYFWKALYSHSYTLLFTCENCDYEFDIDGWFYKFEDIICPKCKTKYSGIFGKVLQKPTDKLRIETFEGEAMAILLPSGSRIKTDVYEHIILVVFSQKSEIQRKPLGLIDYSEPEPEFKLFQFKSNLDNNKSQKSDDRKQTPILKYLFFGMLSVLGIFGVTFVVFPGFFNF